MSKIILLLTCMSILITACTSAGVPDPTPIATSTATEIPATPTLSVTSTPVPFFSVYGDEPIVPKGQGGTWDDRYTDPGAVLYYDGMFHMFRNGFRGFPAESQVGYVISTDGYTWSKQGDDPVFKTSDVQYAKIAIYAS